jgi:hypothetical protein
MGGESYTLTKALKALETLRSAGTLTAEERLTIDTNIDGVLMKFEGEPQTPIALENKTVSTAHGKARTNRWKDAREFAGHVHEVDRRSIAAFSVLINLALDYSNPDEFAAAAKSSGTNKEQAAIDTIRLFTDGMPIRNRPEEPDIWCESVYVLVIRYDGHNPAVLVTDKPAPEPGAPYSYEWFLRRICALYSDRNLGPEHLKFGAMVE